MENKQKGAGSNFMIAINGMGRIGRSLLRLMLEKNQLHRLAVVSDVMTKDNLIYLLRYDSIRGPLSREIVATPKGFRIAEHEVAFAAAQDSSRSWNDYSVDLVVEATGLFTHSQEAAIHLEKGAKKVLLTTYAKDIPSHVWGVNHHHWNLETAIVSPGDCTVNCVAPVLSILQNSFGMESVHVNVIQAYTTRQELLDKPYKGLRRGRAAAHAIIPFEVNIAPVLENLFPLLAGSIETMSTRVPIPCGAFAEVSCMLKKNTNAAEVNLLLQTAASNTLKGITTITFDPIVSSDIIGNTHSGVVDGLLTRVTNERHLRMMIWFDNEWGYTNRLLDWIHHLSAKK